MKGPGGELFSLLIPSLRLFRINPDASSQLIGSLALRMSNSLDAVDIAFEGSKTIWCAYRLWASLGEGPRQERLFVARWSTAAVLRDSQLVVSFDEAPSTNAGVWLSVGAGTADVLCPHIVVDPSERPSGRSTIVLSDCAVLSVFHGSIGGQWVRRPLPSAPACVQAMWAVRSGNHTFTAEVAGPLTLRSLGEGDSTRGALVVDRRFIFTPPSDFNPAMSGFVDHRGRLFLAYQAGIQAHTRSGMPLDYSQITARVLCAPHPFPTAVPTTEVTLPFDESTTAMVLSGADDTGILAVATGGDPQPDIGLPEPRGWIRFWRVSTKH
jgi:hypothetical protein